MKHRFMNFLFILLVTIVAIPYSVKGFDISAYSDELMSFSGTQISGGLATSGSFVPVNDYVVVTANITKWNAPSDWDKPVIYTDLTVHLRIKEWFGYSKVSKLNRGAGSHVLDFVAHKGERYDLYFNSSNNNYWNCYGAVYAEK